MPNSKQIVYLSQAQYQELITNGTITVDGVTVTYNENDIYVTPQAEPVTDVRVAGTSVAANGIANIPLANANTIGAVKIGNGLLMGGNGTGDTLNVLRAYSDQVKKGAELNRPIVPECQHYAAFYGLAKAAGHDEKDSTEPLGTYTPEAKGAIQSMLGVSDLIATAENTLVASKAYAVGDVFTANGKLYKVTSAIAATETIVVQDEGETVSEHNAEECNISNEFIKKTDYASTNDYGIVKIGNGLTISNNKLSIQTAGSATIKQGTASGSVITPEHEYEAAFYGLARAAGDVTQSASSNAVGTYTDEAKSAIRGMLDTISINDIVPKYDSTSTYQKGDYCEYEGKIYFAKVVIATAEEWTADHWTETTLTTYASSQLQRPGLVGITPLWSGVSINNGGFYLNTPSEALIKAGTDNSRVALIHQQHIATFYGLAKASGDTTQSASSNAVGQYTDNAKASIKSMLGIVDGSTGTVSVTGTTPTITAVENTRYVCGEVSTLSITPPASGICIIRFTSGTTATVLTATGVVWPEWFDATALEAERVYEICITDGYGMVVSWAQ